MKSRGYLRRAVSMATCRSLAMLSLHRIAKSKRQEPGLGVCSFETTQPPAATIPPPPPSLQGPTKPSQLICSCSSNAGISTKSGSPGVSRRSEKWSCWSGQARTVDLLLCQIPRRNQAGISARYPLLHIPLTPLTLGPRCASQAHPQMAKALCSPRTGPTIQ